MKYDMLLYRPWTIYGGNRQISYRWSCTICGEVHQNPTPNPTSETIIFRQIIQYYGMKLTWMDSTKCAEYSRGVFINNIAHIYMSTEAVWRARWINWKWTFSHEEMSISNLFSGPLHTASVDIHFYANYTVLWHETDVNGSHWACWVQYKCFINNIAHIYVSTEAVWRCPFPIYSAGPTYCFGGQ